MFLITVNSTDFLPNGSPTHYFEIQLGTLKHYKDNIKLLK